MVRQAPPHTGPVCDNRDSQRLELGPRAHTRAEEQRGRAQSSSRERNAAFVVLFALAAALDVSPDSRAVTPQHARGQAVGNLPELTELLRSLP